MTERDPKHGILETPCEACQHAEGLHGRVFTKQPSGIIGPVLHARSGSCAACDCALYVGYSDRHCDVEKALS